MKRTNLIFMICMLASGCLNTMDKEKGMAVSTGMNNDTRDSTTFTTLQWLDSTKSLGTVSEGQSLKISYRFRNTGHKPLLIERVQPGCGCTVADYPKAPVAPNETGEIMASFDSKGKIGVQKKNITVFANTAQQTYTLWFDVIVNKVE